MQVRRWVAVAAALLGLAVLPASTAAGATAHFQKSFPARGISAVRVDVSFHDVKVVVQDTPEVTVTVDLETSGSGPKAEKLLARYTPTFELEDGRVVVRSRRRHTGWKLGHRSVRGRVRVVLPPGRDVDLATSSGDCSVEGNLGAGSIAADTSSGDVEVAGSARRISAATSSGDVRCDLVGAPATIKASTSSGDVAVSGRAEKIAVDTASGDVELALDDPAQSVDVDTASGDVAFRGGAARFTAGTASGDVRASGLTGSARVETTSGDVSLSWAAAAAGTDIKVDTTSGEVRLELPRTATVQGRVITTSGGIRSDFAGRTGNRGHLLVIDAADAAVHFDIDTTSGGVTLIRR